jgi:hypothetical protein
MAVLRHKKTKKPYRELKSYQYNIMQVSKGKTKLLGETLRKSRANTIYINRLRDPKTKKDIVILSKEIKFGQRL